MNIKSSTIETCSLRLCKQREKPLRTHSGSASLVGLRSSNEDLVFSHDDCQFYVVLDGIGGHFGGAEASRILLEDLRSRIEPLCLKKSQHPEVDLGEALGDAISDATEHMLDVADKFPKYRKMGTVFSMAYVIDRTLLYTRVGDARVYLFRRGQTQQLLHDETYVQLMLDVGAISSAEAEDHPWRNVILNAVGTKSIPTPAAVHTEELQSGDVILLTSDGVSDCLSDDKLAELLSLDAEPSELAQRIVDAALEAGSNDNASCVVVRIAPNFQESKASVDGDELRRELDKLHLMLADLGSVDEKLRDRMVQVAHDIQQALNERDNDTAESGAHLLSTLNQRALEFERNHPDVTQVVGTIAGLLARIGI